MVRHKCEYCGQLYECNMAPAECSGPVNGPFGFCHWTHFREHLHPETKSGLSEEEERKQTGR